MSREWKPGDVAAVNDVTQPDAPWLAATCVAAAIPSEREAEWMLHRSGARVWGSVSKARPLVVLDLEFPATVLKHLRMAAENDAALTTLSWLADRIAEQTVPPSLEVYEHFVGNRDASGVLSALCGKVWKPSDDVIVKGRCPECADRAETGWAS